MPKNPYLRPQVKQTRFPQQAKSKGILDDYAVRKTVNSQEGTVEKEPTNDNDITNKAYVDEMAKKDFYFEVAAGNIEGHTSINKFGENPDVDSGTAPEDVWDYGDVYNFSSTANITQLSSDDPTDDQDVLIQGLDENWEEVIQTVTLTGQTAATLTTPLIRAYRMVNMGSTDMAGNVYLTTTGTELSGGEPVSGQEGGIRAMIRNGNNQTLMCIYTVPAGKTAYFLSGYVTTGKSSNNSATFSWRARPFGGVFQVKSRLAVIGTGSSTWDYHYGVPPALPEKTDVKIVCEEVESNNNDVSGGFDLILVDNE